MGNATTWLFAAPIWLVFLIYAARSIRDWPGIMERWNERLRDKAAIDGDQYARMDARMQRLEDREEKCRQDLAGALQRIAELEGYNIGHGEALQDAQRMLSAEREADAKKRERGK